MRDRGSPRNRSRSSNPAVELKQQRRGGERAPLERLPGGVAQRDRAAQTCEQRGHAEAALVQAIGGRGEVAPGERGALSVQQDRILGADAGETCCVEPHHERDGTPGPPTVLHVRQMQVSAVRAPGCAPLRTRRGHADGEMLGERRERRAERGRAVERRRHPVEDPAQPLERGLNHRAALGHALQEHRERGGERAGRHRNGRRVDARRDRRHRPLDGSDQREKRVQLAQLAAVAGGRLLGSFAPPRSRAGREQPAAGGLDPGYVPLASPSDAQPAEPPRERRAVQLQKRRRGREVAGLEEPAEYGLRKSFPHPAEPGGQRASARRATRPRR